MKTQLVVYLALAVSFAVGMAVEHARAAAQENTRVTGIGGVFFKARDPRALAAWYKQHLGIALEPAGKGADAPAFAMFEWVEKGEPQKAGMTTFAIFPDKTTYFDPSKAPFMINFRVANLDRIRAELKEAGAQVDDKVNDESYGRFGWATDPEGNRFELWEPK
jgi:predicted enzyme related to lactoylglutathione lyase